MQLECPIPLLDDWYATADGYELNTIEDRLC